MKCKQWQTLKKIVFNLILEFFNGRADLPPPRPWCNSGSPGQLRLMLKLSKLDGEALLIVGASLYKSIRRQHWCNIWTRVVFLKSFYQGFKCHKSLQRRVFYYWKQSSLLFWLWGAIKKSKEEHHFTNELGKPSKKKKLNPWACSYLGGEGGGSLSQRSHLLKFFFACSKPTWLALGSLKIFFGSLLSHTS